jgi:hypothetical protein
MNLAPSAGFQLPFIWRTQSSSSPANTWTYFRKEFAWHPAMPAKILFAADPTARLWINGTVVLPRVMRFVSPQITVEEIDLTPYLREGGNTAVVLHHWWGVPTFQRSRGGAPGIAIESEFLRTDGSWCWRNADEFLAHPHQTLGCNTQRIRFPVVMDARLEDPALHDETSDDRKWTEAVSVSSPAWALPVLKETAALEREEVFPVKVEAVGTVTPPPIADAPHPETPTSWLVKHSCYEMNEERAKVARHSLSSLLPGPDGYATLDFGKPLHGYLRLEITGAPAGAVLDFTYGEIRYDLCAEKQVLLDDGSFDPELIVGTPFGDRVTLREGAQTIEIPEERTWRWLMVTWRDASAPIEIQSISIMTSQHPAPGLGSFHAPEVKEIPKLVELCLDHAKVTMSDTYVDTPGREDAQWLEDIQYRALLSAQWFGDHSLRQVTLRHTVEQQAPSGRFRVFPPEDYSEHGLQTFDWGVVWIGMLYDDWMWTGETTRVRLYFSNLVSFLELAHSQTNSDGLLVDRTCMTDIRCALRANLDAGEIESMPNAWYFGFLTNAAALANAIGETAQAEKWQARAGIVRRGFQRFISHAAPTKGLLGEVWSPLDGVRGFGQAATVSAVFHDILEPATARIALESAFETMDGAPPPGVGRWNNPTYAYRALRALSDHGMGETAGEHFLERYRPYLPDGPLPEYFIPGSGQPEDPTGSHGWAAVPLVWLHDTVLGVRLAGAGGRKLIWSPVNVGWQKVRGTTMTPHGPCEVEIDWGRDHFVIRPPEHCTVDVLLPKGGRASIPNGSNHEMTAEPRIRERSVSSVARV